MEYYRFPSPDGSDFSFPFPLQLARTSESVPFGFYRRDQYDEKFIIPLAWTLKAEDYIAFMEAYFSHRGGVPFIIGLPVQESSIVDYRGVFVGGTFRMTPLAPEQYRVEITAEVMPYES